MTEGRQSQDRAPVAAGGGGNRWVMGKSKDQLMADLKLYLGKLREDPRSLSDRLRVAAIQLRLGRVDEAMIHYEGVLGGYIAGGQLLSAAALCQRLLAHFEDLPRIQEIYEQVNARLLPEEGQQKVAEEITAEDLPPEHLDDMDFLDILLQADEEAAAEEAGTARFTVSDVESTRKVRGVGPDGELGEISDMVPPESSAPTDRWAPGEQPILLTDPKEPSLFPEGTDRLSPEYAREDSEGEVVLLTKKKK